MQDVTDLPFMRLLGRFGPPDFFFTEYFRVHTHSTPEKWILDSILHHGTGRPVFAQMIGESIPHLRRTARLLLDYPVAGIDLNLGCPAPKVYRKQVGGGLLRDLPKVDRVLGALREIISSRFTIKTRLGFEDTNAIEPLCQLVDKHQLDGLSIHGRTVRQMYRGEVHYPLIAQAATKVSCPVFANGNIQTASEAHAVHRSTGAFGVMCGRAAIRNPFLFRQIRESSADKLPFQPRLHHIRDYVDLLWDAVAKHGLPERNRLNRMKKFLNFVGQSVDPQGAFLKEMRRAREPADFFAVCDHWLARQDRADLPFADQPYPGVLARPNHEQTPACAVTPEPPAPARHAAPHAG